MPSQDLIRLDAGASCRCPTAGGSHPRQRDWRQICPQRCSSWHRRARRQRLARKPRTSPHRVGDTRTLGRSWCVAHL